MRLFVALAALLVGCAQASEDRTGDGGTVDGSAATDGGTTDGAIDARPDASPDACVPTAELCNMADDNCNGMADEGLGLGTMCDGPNDTDACMEGMVMCDGAGGTVCADMTGSTTELCNGMDDDCKNGIDDTFNVNQPCTAGLGACARNGTYMCNTAMTGTTCSATAGTPTAETCGNVTDEDCNGADATCPPNDLATGAINISNGGTWTVDLTTSHDDNWASGTGCGNQGGRDVFYTFTLPAEEVVYYDTFGSNFDSVVRIFAGACTGIGATQSCADDLCSTQQTQGAINLAAGTYCLVVDQYSSNTTAGMLTLNFKRGRRSGQAIAATTSTITGTTAGRTNQSTAGCEAMTTQPDFGLFYLTCPNRTYTVSANTCTSTAFDTVLYMRQGAANTADIACNDDSSGCGSSGFQSRITGASVSGANLNWIIVDGYGTSGNGSFSLSLTVQ